MTKLGVIAVQGNLTRDQFIRHILEPMLSVMDNNVSPKQHYNNFALATHDCSNVLAVVY